MGAPPKIQPRGLADYLELRARAVFQAGLSWPVGERKRESFPDACCRSDPPPVAGFDHTDSFPGVVNEPLPVDEDRGRRRGLGPRT